jgi:hypothetical protein
MMDNHRKLTFKVKSKKNINLGKNNCEINSPPNKNNREKVPKFRHETRKRRFKDKK